MLPLLHKQQLVEQISQIKDSKNMTWEQIAHALYQILDDIDTCDDACRENAESFRSNVMRLQAKKNQYLFSPDGYDLQRVDEEEQNNQDTREIPLTNSPLKAIVDASDYDQVSRYTWFLKKDGRTNVRYVARSVKSGGKVVTVRLHRLLTNAGPGEDVHHKDHDPLNNRRSNLEIIPAEQHKNYHTTRSPQPVQEFKKAEKKPAQEGWYVVDMYEPEELIAGPYDDKEKCRASARLLKQQYPKEDIHWGLLFVPLEDTTMYSAPDWQEFKVWMNKVDKTLLRFIGKDSRGIYDWHYRDDFDDGVSPQESAKSAVEYFRSMRGASESKMSDWAKDELQKAGLFDKDSDYEGMLGEAVLDLIEKFAEQGHSGFSAELTAQLFDRLIHWKPLTELTDDPLEWVDVSEKMGQVVYQSKRCPSCFSKDGGLTYYDIDECSDKEELVYHTSKKVTVSK